MELLPAREAHRESLRVIRDNLPAEVIATLDRKIRAAAAEGKTSTTIVESELLDRVSPKTMRAIEAYVKTCGYGVTLHYGAGGFDLSWG